MELMLLRVFQKQVLLQCQFLMQASADINTAINATIKERGNNHAVFYALQNFLNAAADISKALWGQRGKLASERKDLRDSIGIADDSPLTEVNMRNNFEHFDERLDR